MPGDRPGEIITFYSYKGGTGRSMLLANVAWIMATNGARVLAVDWDLEAPGLHRYFRPFLVDKDLTSSDGVIDWVIDFSIAAVSTPATSDPPGERWFLPYANILRYAASLEWDFPDEGTLDFVGAGRQGASYSTRVNSFNWQDFYDRFGGGVFLEEAKGLMRQAYDYVLVDSRTGVSDTSGICTLQLPDSLVVCFTLNNQSVEGAAAVAESVVQQRGKTRPIRVFPVPMRVENSEKAKLELRKTFARERFPRLPEELLDTALERYWSDVEVLYVPFYAYEEMLATFGDRPEERHSVLAASERIAGYLTGGAIQNAVRPSEARRLQALAAYEGGLLEAASVDTAATAGGGIFISYRRTDSSGAAGRLYDALSSRFGAQQVFMDIDTIEPGVDFVSSIDQTIRSSSVVLVIIGRRWLEQVDNPDDFVRLELAAALNSDVRVIPILVDGAAMPSTVDLPDELAGVARRNALELSSERWRYDVENLLRNLDMAFASERSRALRERPGH